MCSPLTDEENKQTKKISMCSVNMFHRGLIITSCCVSVWKAVSGRSQSTHGTHRTLSIEHLQISVAGNHFSSVSVRGELQKHNLAEWLLCAEVDYSQGLVCVCQIPLLLETCSKLKMSVMSKIALVKYPGFNPLLFINCGLPCLPCCLVLQLNILLSCIFFKIISVIWEKVHFQAQ